MTRFRMGAPVTAPQDAPGRGSKPAPSTPGEPVLKPNRTTGFPAVEGKPAVYGGRGCHLFVLLMPLLIVFWIPGVGPFTLISRFVQRLAGFYAPILFMTLPVALLLRLGELLGESFSLSLGGVGAWLLALLIPVAALFAPLVMFWQAGALFFLRRSSLTACLSRPCPTAGQSYA